MPSRSAAALVSGLLACVVPASEAAGRTPARARPAAAAVVRPGTLVRWPGAQLEWCELGAQRFAPIAGACLYPVDLLQPAGPLTLRRSRDGRLETRDVRVGRYDYPVQRLTLPPGMVELSPEDLARVERENAEIARLWERDGERRFALPLQPPLERMPRGGRFGSRRFINGEPRSPHGGADFAAARGTPVLAAADGVVAMVGRHFFGGNAVFLDHGDRLVTMYFHLDRVDVVEGQQVRRGERVGAVGSTGRSSGPHLHFGVRWRGARVDPRQLLRPPQAIPGIQ